MSAAHYDAVIAGGGIVGAACAAALSKAGMRVALVERHGLGSGATAAGMGHVVVMDDSPPQFALTRYSQQLWHALAPQLGEGAEYQACGTIWIAADDEEMAEARRKHEYLRERAVPSRLLSPAELAVAEPSLRAGLAGALLVSEDIVVYPPAVTLHLAAEARAHEATLFMGRIVRTMGAGEAVLDDGTVLAAPRLINAAGAWAPGLTPGVPVRKRKGHLAVTGARPDFARHQVVELGYLKSAHASTADSVAFNLQPRRSGQLVIGSSRQYGSETTAVEPAILAAMLARASHFMPELSTLPIMREWAGFRAATPDKLPLIGPSADDETLWLATGHEGLGITASLATAALIAADFTGALPPIPNEPYLPARFARASL